MEMIFMKRGEGKTTKLICMSHLNNIPIVVVNAQMARLVKKKALDMSLSIPDPIVGATLQGLSFNLRRKNIDKVYIDDAEYILPKLFEDAFNVKLEGFSMSTNDKDLYSESTL